MSVEEIRMTSRLTLGLFVLSSLNALMGAVLADDAGPMVPVALAWDRAAKLHVAARDGQSLITVDPDGWRITQTWPIGIRPVSLVTTDDAQFLVGGTNGEMLVVGEDGSATRRVDVGRGVARVVALPAGRAAVG